MCTKTKCRFVLNIATDALKLNDMNKLFSALALFVMVLTISCGALTKAAIKNDGKQMPPYFGNTPSTLLVIRQNRNMDEKPIEKVFQKYYTGPYEIIDEGELSNEKYSDTSKYRYYFNMNHESHSRYTASGSSNIAVWGFSVTDRSTNQTFYSKMASLYKKVLEKYVETLNEVRIKNETK